MKEESNKKLDEELKELSFLMMLNETGKLQMENAHTFSVRAQNGASLYSTKAGIESGLLNADKRGFDLSLTFNELLLKNGKSHNKFDNGPDAVDIWAENLLYKYNLHYPLSWEVAYEDSDGLHFSYNKSDKINKNHEEFLKEVDKLKISEFEKKRIIAIAEYYKKRRKLLSKYYNNEVFEEEKEHTR